MTSAIEHHGEIHCKNEDFLMNLTLVRADELGLDPRAGYTLFIDEEKTAIIVDKRNDRTLQYYGGFEYIGEDLRCEVGEYVFYLRDEEGRVDECFKHLEEVEAEDKA